jgi:hypothetical protein
VLKVVNNKALKNTISATGSVPGVSGEHMLTEGEFGLPGAIGFQGNWVLSFAFCFGWHFWIAILRP